MSEPGERETYPVWVAMGAALVGTLLGGGAVWLGVGGRLDALEQGRGEVAAPAEVAGERAGETEPSAALEQASLVEVPDDPRDSPLVRAVARTRDAVVTLSVAGGVRGAGVVYDEAGLLLTNYHVIEPVLRAQLVFGDEAAGSLTARFVDGRERGARIVAADPDEDVAILSLIRERDEERFAAVAVGRSAELRLGEQVFSIGSPVGFEGTVGTGIVSALQRTDVLSNRRLAVIQLDAAVNFGNSGGPLFNLVGELVGITTARSSRGEGIGFAIPIDRVRLFLQALHEGKRGRAGAIGVELDVRGEVDERIAALGYHSGVAVSAVEKQGPAAQAGMRKGDVIVAIRGRRHDELDSSRAGRAAFAHIVGDTIRALIPGEPLDLTVVRNGELVELELTVAAASPVHQAGIDAERMLGLRLRRDDLRIEALVAGSPISRMRGAEVLHGAKIVSIFGQSVETRAQLGEHLESLRSWAAGGGRRSIAIGFETADGRTVSVSNFPLAN